LYRGKVEQFSLFFPFKLDYMIRRLAHDDATNYSSASALFVVKHKNSYQQKQRVRIIGISD